MARPLSERARPQTDSRQDGQLARSTARAFAAAISALLISTLVVTRSGAALQIDGTVAGSTFTSGTIALADDDQGQSLFDLSDMAPGRPIQRCLNVIYDGTILPVDLSLQATGKGTLLPYLEASIEEGSGGAFESCEEFTVSGVVFSGDLQELSDRGHINLGPILNSGERRSFRITFDLADTEDALGQAGSADFVWEVTPS